jgi:hypothetical protein
VGAGERDPGDIDGICSKRLGAYETQLYPRDDWIHMRQTNKCPAGFTCGQRIKDSLHSAGQASSCRCTCMDSSRCFPQMDVAVHRFAELLRSAIFAASVADPVDARPGDVRRESEDRSVDRELHDVIAHGVAVMVVHAGAEALLDSDPVRGAAAAIGAPWQPSPWSGGDPRRGLVATLAVVWVTVRSETMSVSLGTSRRREVEADRFDRLVRDQ